MFRFYANLNNLEQISMQMKARNLKMKVFFVTMIQMKIKHKQVNNLSSTPLAVFVDYYQEKHENSVFPTSS